MRLLITAGLVVLAGFYCAPAAAQGKYTVTPYSLNGDTPLSTNPLQIDWNRDGVPDFLASSDLNQNLISTNGAYVYKTLNMPFYPGATGDFNNDGQLDIVSYFNGYLYLSYGQSNGSFVNGPSTQGLGGSAFVVADFNQDGRPDVAVSYTKPATTTTGGAFGIELYLNNGNGFNAGKSIFEFSIAADQQFGYPNLPISSVDLLLGDFDADGHADLVFRTLHSSLNGNPPAYTTGIRVLYGDGKGNFTLHDVGSGNVLDQISVADMNNDGASDIVANNGGQTILYYGYPYNFRTFTSSFVDSPDGLYLNPMLVDINGDGLKDIVYAATCTSGSSCPGVPSGEVSGGVVTLWQNTKRAFTSSGFTPVHNYTPSDGYIYFTGAFVGDYNHDGKLDAALFAGDQQSGFAQDNFLYLIQNSRSIPAYCPAPATPGFHVCSPAGGQTVASPVKFNFSASSFYAIRKMEVWIDGTKRSETYNSVGNQAFANPSVSLTAGTHKVTLFYGGYDGSVRSTSYSINVP